MEDTPQRAPVRSDRAAKYPVTEIVARLPPFDPVPARAAILASGDGGGFNADSRSAGGRLETEWQVQMRMDLQRGPPAALPDGITSARLLSAFQARLATVSAADKMFFRRVLRELATAESTRASASDGKKRWMPRMKLVPS